MKKTTKATRPSRRQLYIQFKAMYIQGMKDAMAIVEEERAEERKTFGLTYSVDKLSFVIGRLKQAIQNKK